MQLQQRCGRLAAQPPASVCAAQPAAAHRPTAATVADIHLFAFASFKFEWSAGSCIVRLRLWLTGRRCSVCSLHGRAPLSAESASPLQVTRP